MAFKMPQPIADYFAADELDGDTVSRCFTDFAIVKDEGRVYEGRAAIKSWKEEASAKDQYICEPLGVENHEGRTVVTCRLAENFPGSPTDLRFRFELAGEKIAALEIAP